MNRDNVTIGLSDSSVLKLKNVTLTYIPGPSSPETVKIENVALNIEIDYHSIDYIMYEE